MSAEEWSQRQHGASSTLPQTRWSVVARAAQTETGVRVKSFGNDVIGGSRAAFIGSRPIVGHEMHIAALLVPDPRGMGWARD